MSEVDGRGRPTEKTPELVQKLEQALQNGFTIDKACQVSGIGRTTYYNWLKDDSSFSEQMELAKEWATERARQVLVTSIQGGDVASARWWLERKSSDEFGNKQKLEGVLRTENTFKQTDDEEVEKMRLELAAALTNMIPAQSTPVIPADDIKGGLTVEESAPENDDIQNNEGNV